MLTLLRKIFTWWNQDTFGTRLKTIFFGKLVGTDELGNKYYEDKKKNKKFLLRNFYNPNTETITKGTGVYLHTKNKKYL